MGCGGNQKDVAAATKPLQSTPLTIPLLLQQPQAPKPRPTEKPGKLPQIVLDGMAKILHIPVKMNKGRRAKPKAQGNPFTGIIEDPVPSAPGHRSRPHIEKPFKGKSDSAKKETVNENPFPAPAQDDMQGELRKQIEGEDGSKPVEVRSSQAKKEGNREESKADPIPVAPLSEPGFQPINSSSLQPSDPTVQSSIPLSADAWVGANALPLDSFPKDRLSSEYIGAEEEVTGTAAAPHMQRPTTSQAAAAERLAKMYNQERGLSPEPPEEFSDEDEEYDGVVDEARRQARLAREKESEEEAQRLAAERRAEEERQLAAKAAYMDVKKNEAANILSKYQ